MLDSSERIIHSMGEVRRDAAGKAVEIFGTLQDITDSKRMENALRDNEERYRALIEKSYDIVYSVRPDGTIAYVSPQIARYGYDPETLPEHNFFEFIPAAYREFLAGKFRDTTILGEISPTEFKFQGKDGREYWAEVTGKMVYGEGRRPLFQVGTVRDISERKQADEALKNSELKFKTLFEGVSTAIFIVDVDTRRIVDCNMYAARLVGRAKEELIGLHHGELHPHGSAQPCRNALEPSKDGIVVNLEAELMHKDGHRIPILVNSTYMDVEGKKFMIWSYMDISGRKRIEEALWKSEEIYRSLVEDIQIIIWEIDENYRCTYMNPRSLNVLGYEPEEIMGKTPLDFIVPEDIDHVRAIVMPLLEGHKPFEVMKYRVMGKDGRRILFKTSAVPVFDDAGRFKGYRGVNRAIADGNK